MLEKKLGHEWMVYKKQDGSTHTWYYPSLKQIENGMITNIKILN
jgi:hypothetical protein